MRRSGVTTGETKPRNIRSAPEADDDRSHQDYYGKKRSRSRLTRPSRRTPEKSKGNTGEGVIEDEVPVYRQPGQPSDTFCRSNARIADVGGGKDEPAGLGLVEITGESTPVSAELPVLRTSVFQIYLPYFPISGKCSRDTLVFFKPLKQK